MTAAVSYRWVVAPPADDARARALVQALNIPPALAALLVQRGFGEPADAKRYLRPDLETLTDPYLLKDMDRAVATITAAVRARHRIMVHGDYDVDGQCATALLTRVLREAGADVVPFVPNRIRDGYDLGPAGLAKAQAHDVRLIVTCDCGTTAVGIIEQARAAGIQVVVTDHHLTRVTPPADAVVNPQQPDCGSPSKELCGSGVAFKLAQALVAELRLPENLPYHLLDYVALATVADMVPLVRENRTLVRYGLRLLSRSRWPGLRALLRATALEGQQIRAGQVSFILAPRLNAAGRIADAGDGLRLLLTDDEAEAAALAQSLEAINTRRQAIDEEILAQALEDIEHSVDLDLRYGLVLARDGWHPGVIGLVASRVVERFTRPTILVALEGEQGRGSGRSIPGFDLHAALTECSPYLARYGGHRMAAGLTVERDRLPEFRDAFDAVARERLTPDDLVPTQRIDLVVRMAELTDELERLLRHLEPCGAGNPGAVLGVTRATARHLSIVGSNHLKFVLEDGTGRLEAIGFGWADRVERGWADQPVDVAFRLDRNEWRGSSTLQARVVQIKPSE